MYAVLWVLAPEGQAAQGARYASDATDENDFLRCLRQKTSSFQDRRSLRKDEKVVLPWLVTKRQDMSSYTQQISMWYSSGL